MGKESIKEKNHWERGVTVLPNDFGDDILNDAHFRLAVKIMSFQAEGSKALSLTYLKSVTGLHRVTLVNGLREMERLGYIKRRPRRVMREATVFDILPEGGR